MSGHEAGGGLDGVEVDLDTGTVRVRVDGGFAEVHSAAGRVELPVDGALALSAAAGQLLTDGRVEEAIDAFENARAVAPSNPEIAYGLSTAYAKAGRLDEALAEADRGLVLGRPADGRHLVNRGSLRGQLGDPDGARADLELALGVAENRVQTLLARAEVRHGRQEYDAAVADLDQLVAESPEHPDAWFLRGLAQVKLSRYADAVESFTRDVEAGSPTAVTYANRAACLVATGRRGQALADFDRAIGLEPDDLSLRRRRAEPRLSLADLPGAIADLDAVLTAHPDDVQARHGRAITRASSGDADGAVADFEVLISAGVEHAPVWSNYGWALQQCGRLDDARTAYRSALRLDPDYHQAQHNLDALAADT